MNTIFFELVLLHGKKEVGADLQFMAKGIDSPEEKMNETGYKIEASTIKILCSQIARKSAIFNGKIYTAKSILPEVSYYHNNSPRRES